MSKTLTESLKEKALEMGITKVGIASPENLAGPPEADPGEILEGWTKVISFLIVEPEEAILKYLGKEDPKPYRDHFYENHMLLGRVGLAMADMVKSAGHNAVALSPNGVYKEGSNIFKGLVPPFSHRYGAVAAGLGAIGRSGNLMTPEYGSRVHLGSVITDAPLDADQPLDENPCDNCLTCVNACPAKFMDGEETVTFTMGGREITHAKKGNHVRCGISCGGFTGLGPDGTWSTLAPSIHPVPEDDGELTKLFSVLLKEYFKKREENPGLPNFLKLGTPMEGYPVKKQGLLARDKHDTQTTCGNCAIICFEDMKKRAVANKALKNSGVVVDETVDGIKIENRAKV